MKSNTLTTTYNTRTEELVNIRKLLPKYARLKRKLTLVHRKYKDQPQKQADLVVRFLKEMENEMKLSNIITIKRQQQIHGTFNLTHIYHHNRPN